METSVSSDGMLNRVLDDDHLEHEDDGIEELDQEPLGHGHRRGRLDRLVTLPEDSSGADRDDWC